MLAFFCAKYVKNDIYFAYVKNLLYLCGRKGFEHFFLIKISMKQKIFTLFIAAICCASMMAGDISEFQVTENIDYVGDGHTGHKLDIYFPKADGKAKHPVIIHIYGSAWQMNDMKGTDRETIGVAALEAGYIFVTPNHRSVNDAKFPAQINDIKAVVRYLRGNAETLGIDTSYIAMTGFSSGGHLSVLMGVTRNVRMHTVGSVTMDIEGNIGNYTSESSWVHAVCEWSGPIDEEDKTCGTSLLPDYVLDALVGCSKSDCPDRHVMIGAYTYLDASDAPMMLVYGKSDNIVPYCMGNIFYNNLQSTSIDAEMYSHNGGHEVAEEFTDEMITFFNRVKGSAQAIESPSLQGRSGEASKVIRDGVLLIERNGRTFNAQGIEVK